MLRRLCGENARFKELQAQHGIVWQEPANPEPAPASTHFTTEDKIALFRGLFRGREDVYPQRQASSKGPSTDS